MRAVGLLFLITSFVSPAAKLCVRVFFPFWLQISLSKSGFVKRKDYTLRVEVIFRHDY